jgi:hypothetical protein
MAGTTSAPSRNPGSRLLTAALLVLVGIGQGAVSQRAGAVVSATIARAQVGPVVTAASGGVTPTLLAASTAGTLLIATLAGQNNANFTGPGAPWVFAARVGRTNDRAEVWYYPNNPGGITSAGTFTNGGTSFTAGQLSEWSGVATSSPLDQTGTNTAGTAGTSLAVTTSAATTLAGDLVVTSFSEALTTAATATFTPGTSWTNLGNTGASSIRWKYAADYRLGVAAGIASETQTSNKSGTWAGAIAAFKPLVCSGGSLTLPAPSAVSFPSVTLTGLDQTKTAASQLNPNDATGSGSGWNVQGTSTTFTSAGSSLPTTATQLTSASVTAGSGTCSLPTNSVSYPMTLPAATTAPPAVKLYNAAANTGGGSLILVLNFALSVPANARSGTYSSSWTFSIASGP